MTPCRTEHELLSTRPVVVPSAGEEIHQGLPELGAGGDVDKKVGGRVDREQQVGQHPGIVYCRYRIIFDAHHISDLC